MLHPILNNLKQQFFLCVIISIAYSSLHQLYTVLFIVQTSHKQSEIDFKMNANGRKRAIIVGTGQTELVTSFIEHAIVTLVFYMFLCSPTDP